MKALRIAAGICIVLTAVAVVWADDQPKKSKRHISPVNNAATETQPINETREDTARINAARRASSTSYVRDDGYTVYVDTITGEAWVDSTAAPVKKKSNLDLLGDLSISVDLWNPVLRIFGQEYGLIGFQADISLYNRYFPTLEIGLGSAKHADDNNKYTYRTAASPYFKIGLDYNFLANGDADYKFFGGLRYGYTPFKWSVDDIYLDAPYWQESSQFNLDQQSSTVGWLEFSLGLRVKLFSNISAGWYIRYHSILHETKNDHGEPWYIPGYGTRGSHISGAFTLTYSLPIKRKAAPLLLDPIPDDESPTPPDTLQ